MKEPHYDITPLCMPVSENQHFHLHCHEQYEILLFLEGDAKYIVEEKTYALDPCDLIIIRKHEMHRIYHNRPTRYQRIVLMVSPDFFKNNQCQNYEEQFLHPHAGTDNKISAEIVRSSGIYDAFMKYKKYSEDYSIDPNSPILIATVIEILYLINKTTGFASSDGSNGPMKSIISYLNNRYTEDITLDMLAGHFFLSKYYLCRAFHKATGLTIHQYITRKRLTLVRELKEKGKNISEAAMEAGFKDYSCFYRAYQKEYGISPREDLG